MMALFLGQTPRGAAFIAEVERKRQGLIEKCAGIKPRSFILVIPAKAGIQKDCRSDGRVTLLDHLVWIPAFAGMTKGVGGNDEMWAG